MREPVTQLPRATEVILWVVWSLEELQKLGLIKDVPSTTKDVAVSQIQAIDSFAKPSVEEICDCLHQCLLPQMMGANPMEAGYGRVFFGLAALLVQWRKGELRGEEEWECPGCKMLLTVREPCPYCGHE